eukprot:TRINITY_DN5685_c0_g1_i1.p1 TRINITY_DN5685_c0_g1~~TRINITY_DN5685_c0_g1_i1.p1  ORF type:complete len:343 (+),score=30.48 TRINITY_DN5685_c0_g1_i1:50-1030(+)
MAKAMSRMEQAKVYEHPPLVIGKELGKKYQNKSMVYIRACVEAERGEVVIVVTRFMLFVCKSHKGPPERMVKYSEVMRAVYFASKRKKTSFEVVLKIRDPEPDVHLFMTESKLNVTNSNEEEIVRFLQSINRCREVLFGSQCPIARSDTPIEAERKGNASTAKEQIEKGARIQFASKETTERRIIQQEEDERFQALHSDFTRRRSEISGREPKVVPQKKPDPQPVPVTTPRQADDVIPQQKNAQNYVPNHITVITAKAPPQPPKWRPVTPQVTSRVVAAPARTPQVTPSAKGAEYWANFIAKWEDRAVVTNRLLSEEGNLRAVKYL